MWKFLYQMASPRSFYNLTQPCLKWSGFAACVLLMIGFVWGLFIAPPDYQQGEAFRIIYVHVPAAFMSMALYAAMAFCAFLLLIWQIKMAGLLITVLARMGALMAFLALVTGSIWGKPMWGTWWVWDARLTSELILLLLYAAIIALSASFQQKNQGDRMLAILTLVGLVDLPVIHFSVYWWNTLHQGATLSLFARPKIAPAMLHPLVLTLCGFALFCVWSVLHQTRQQILLREKNQRWVKALFGGQAA